MNNDLVMVAVDVGVDTIETFEELTHGGWEVFGERHTDAGWECGFVVDVRLHPGHEMLDVLGSGHLGRFAVARGGILPEILEPREKLDLARDQSCVDYDHTHL